MRMRKLLSICALTLAVAGATTVSAQAAQVAKGGITATEAEKQIVNATLKNKKVVSGVSINATTVLGDYLTDASIEEINKALTTAGLEAQVSATDKGSIAEAKVVKELLGLEKDKKVAVLKSLRESAKEEYVSLEGKSDEEALKAAKNYVKADKYGTLTVGTDSEGRRAVALENSHKEVLLLVTADEVDKAIDRLADYSSYDDLKALKEENIELYNAIVAYSNL